MIVLFALTSVIYLWMIGHDLIKHKEIRNITLFYGLLNIMLGIITLWQMTN